MERKNNNTTRRASPTSKTRTNLQTSNFYYFRGSVGFEDGGQAKEKRNDGYINAIKNLFLAKFEWISQNTLQHCKWKKKHMNMFLTLNSSSQQLIRSKKNNNLVNLMLMAIFIFFFLDQLGQLLYKTRMKYTPRHLRPSASSPIIPLFINSFHTKKTHKPLFPTFSTLKAMKKRKRKHPSYGSIKYNSLEPYEDARFIKEILDDKSGHVFTSADFKNGNDDYLDSYYADDDHVRHPSCRRVSWHKLYNPSCNKFHEINMGKISYIAHGYYRDVWAPNNKNETVLKTLRMKHKFQLSQYEFTRMDALVMERLTSSPRIADIFGHCAVSVMTEHLPMELESKIISGSGYASDNPLNDTDDVDPKNDFTPTEKLNMALEMSEAIADLHGFKDGVIVHDDIQLCQFLRSKDGIMKLNDFNRAEVMLWHDEEQQYCKYQNGQVFGNYRAPEEFKDLPLDEKIDIFSLGNNFYGLLTGLWIFYEDEDDEVAQEKMINEKQAYIDPRYRNRTYAESALVEIMEECWTYDPDERIDIFEIVQFLRDAVEENNRLEQ